MICYHLELFLCSQPSLLFSSEILTNSDSKYHSADALAFGLDSSLPTVLLASCYSEILPYLRVQILYIMFFNRFG